MIDSGERGAANTASATEKAAGGGISDHRRGPRRRGGALLAAIFEATLTELAEVGYAGLSMAAVAGRARVSKASLYRRWPSKTALVIDAVYSMLPDPSSIEDRGDLRADLLAVFARTADLLNGPFGQGMRAVISALADPGGQPEIRSRAQGRGVQTIREIVRRAARRGELSDAVPTERQLEVGHAMIRQQFLWHGHVGDDYIVAVVDEVLIPLFTKGDPAVPAG